MKSLSPQPHSIQPPHTLSSRQNYYHSNQVSTPVIITPPKGPPIYLANKSPYKPSEIPNKFSFTPTESHFFQPNIQRSITPTIVQHDNRNNISRSNSPYLGCDREVVAQFIPNPNLSQAQNNFRQQRLFNVTNVARENKHKMDLNINGELTKEKERNTSLSKKLEILEEIVGNSGLELMEQKINKLLSENDRLASILQENKGSSNKTQTTAREKTEEKNNIDLLKENERLNKVIQTRVNEIELWKKRWNEAERASLHISKPSSSRDFSQEQNKLRQTIKEKNEEIEKLSKKLKYLMEDSNLQEIENKKKITILLQENNKLNLILNNQIDELDHLSTRYQEIESKQINTAAFENQFESIQGELAESNQKISMLLQENEFLMEKVKEQDKDLSSIKILEQKIEMIVEENVKNNNLLKLKVEECEFFRKIADEGKFNLDFVENESENRKQIIEELKTKINILIDENKKLNESVALKIGENIALAALEEKIDMLMEDNRKLTDLNEKIRKNEFHNKTNNKSQPDEILIYKEKSEFLEKKNLILHEEMEKIRAEYEKCAIENQQIGEIEAKTELLIEENSNLNNLISEKDEEIFYWKDKFLNSQNGLYVNGEKQN